MIYCAIFLDFFDARYFYLHIVPFYLDLYKMHNDKKFFEKSVKKCLTKGKKGDNIGALPKKRDRASMVKKEKSFEKVLKKA